MESLIIDNVISGDEYADARRKAKEEAWMHIGESAKRTVDYLIAKHDELDRITEAETVMKLHKEKT